MIEFLSIHSYVGITGNEVVNQLTKDTAKA